MRKAFTLIELLVVVTIIALLASLMFAGFSYMQEKSRDTRRAEDINQIVKALNLYFTDHYKFPLSSAHCVGGSCDEVVIDGSSDPLSAALIGAGAMKMVPTDPLYPDPTYRYFYRTDSSGRSYVLRFCQETDAISSYHKGCNNEKTN